MNTKTTAERVSALRQRRADAGLVRLDVYAHPADHPKIKECAATLQSKRVQPKGAK